MTLACRGLIGCDRRSRSFSCVLIAVMYHNAILPRYAEIAGQIVVSFSACWVVIWRGIVESIWRGILESWAVFLMMVALLSLGFSAVFSVCACCSGSFAMFSAVFSVCACCSGSFAMFSAVYCSSSCLTECSGWVDDWVDWWAGWVACKVFERYV